MSLKFETKSKIGKISISDYGYLDGKNVGISISFLGDPETFVINEHQAEKIIKHLKEQFGL